MTKSLKIGLLHLAPTLGALDANRALAAAGLGAEWIVSGELVVCGNRFAPVLGTEWIGVARRVGAEAAHDLGRRPRATD